MARRQRQGSAHPCRLRRHVYPPRPVAARPRKHLFNASVLDNNPLTLSLSLSLSLSRENWLHLELDAVGVQVGLRA